MLLVVHLLNALKEGLVEHNLVVQVSEHGLYLLLNLAQFRRLVGFDKGKEDAAHTVEQSSALLEGQDGVLEGGRLLAVYNLLDVFTLVLDSCLESGQIVRRLDGVKVWNVVGRVALLQQRVLGLCLLTGTQ